ncbi:hypothetical protein NP233_g2962 [Leucocoprinus birnbaumii]|uniref:N-acetyltransferase domain-containing protein n=1 Tax=Leucocoprinus birnbaumii TaxID=56174 RepID=A0AAD5VXZ1_9AGAR|nr:hypothetical protein NP233_g2962 [Leucocoprinus birnbaumii]
MLGIAMSFRSRYVGCSISLTAGVAILTRFGLAFRMVSSAIEENLIKDLVDVPFNYGLAIAREPDKQRDGNLTTSGPGGFWVVEATHSITGKKELVGCGGLAFIQDRKEGELRRVAVSCRHSRRGVASMIIQATLAHAKTHNLPSIYLLTSSLQDAAVALYKKHGWVVEKTSEELVVGCRVCTIHMRVRLKEQLFFLVNIDTG